MNKLLGTVCLTTALSFGSFGLAQTATEDAQQAETTPTPETTATTDAAATDAPVEPTQDTASPANAFPTAEEQAAASDPVVEDGQEYVKEVHGDWQIRCVKGQEETGCTLYQLLKDENGNSVAEFNLVALPKGGNAVGGVTFVSPLGTLLTSQVGMRIDSGKTRGYAFSWCEAAGCISRFGLANADLNALKRGNAASVTIRSIASDKPINLTLSLSGITAAWDAVTQ